MGKFVIGCRALMMIGEIGFGRSGWRGFLRSRRAQRDNK